MFHSRYTFCMTINGLVSSSLVEFNIYYKMALVSIVNDMESRPTEKIVMTTIFILFYFFLNIWIFKQFLFQAELLVISMICISGILLIFCIIFAVLYYKIRKDASASC